MVDDPSPDYDRFPSQEVAETPDRGVDSDRPVDPREEPSLASWHEVDTEFRSRVRPDVAIHCGWGRLIFGHTFSDPQTLVDTLLGERSGERDVALYIRDPQVVLSKAPHRLFLDPSYTYRFDLRDEHRIGGEDPIGITVRGLANLDEAVALSGLFSRHRMVPVDPAFAFAQRESQELSFVVAVDGQGRVVGCVTGVDHVAAFRDPEGGSSLWTLAVDPEAAQPGIGTALIRHLVDTFAARGRQWMDLSVLSDNQAAIRLYEKLGFRRVPVFCIKHKHNPVNEALYRQEDPAASLNPYARIIADEARRRGIAVEVIDRKRSWLCLTWGGREIACWESLTALTSAVAMARCSDKQLTAELLAAEGLPVPEQRLADGGTGDVEFLRRHGRVVVKPLAGEQGRGIAVDIRSEADLQAAIAAARRYGDAVLIEQFVAGEDLRILVINRAVVAAAVRRPPEIVGDGRLSIREAIDKLSRRRQAATGGESTIPIDAETERTVVEAGRSLEEVLPKGERLRVRKTANLHTGASLQDITADLHPALASAALRAAEVLEIPVVGFDFILADPGEPRFVIIEANERPGLANHEPQPTAARFVDFLFPDTADNPATEDPAP